MHHHIGFMDKIYYMSSIIYLAFHQQFSRYTIHIILLHNIMSICKLTSGYHDYTPQKTYMAHITTLFL